MVLALVLLFRRPRSLAWRLATVGAVGWAIEEVAWSVSRSLGNFSPSFFTELGYYLGAAAWLAALLLSRGKRRSRTLLLAAIPPVGLVAWLLIGDLGTATSFVFPLVEFGLLLAALPFLGGVLRGGASEGRLLVVGGFFFRALGAASYTWLGGGTDPGYSLLWLLGYICLAIGIYMELNDLHVDFVASGVTVVAIQLAAGQMLAFIYGSQVHKAGPEAVAVIGSLAYLQLAVVVVTLMNNNQRHMRAQVQMRTWAALLEQLLTEAGEAPTLAGLMDRTLKAIPLLEGIEIHTEASIGDLSGYPYPLVTGGTEVGRLFFQHQPDATVGLESSVPLLAARIQQLREQQRWRTAALTDPLTNLLNRRGLEARAKGLIDRARTTQKPVSVALLDIDHFKRVNDVYGHATGDEALKMLALLLERHIRPHDLAVRWGGEEFLVVLISDLPGAEDAMRRIRRELSATPLGAIAWPLAASVGLAGGAVPVSEQKLAYWVEQADEALLRAKAMGRNRIETARA
jgi:diguanylate cyclase (GGDEF)-like protein